MLARRRAPRLAQAQAAWRQLRTQDKLQKRPADRSCDPVMLQSPRRRLLRRRRMSPKPTRQVGLQKSNLQSLKIRPVSETLTRMRPVMNTAPIGLPCRKQPGPRLVTDGLMVSQQAALGPMARRRKTRLVREPVRKLMRLKLALFREDALRVRAMPGLILLMTHRELRSESR